MKLGFQFTRDGLKDFKKLDKPIQERVFRKIEYWAKRDDPLDFSKPLEGHKDFFRYRVGDWRIIVKLESETSIIKIIAIGHQSNVYGDY